MMSCIGTKVRWCIDYNSYFVVVKVATANNKARSLLGYLHPFDYPLFHITNVIIIYLFIYLFYFHMYILNL